MRYLAAPLARRLEITIHDSGQVLSRQTTLSTVSSGFARLLEGWAKLQNNRPLLKLLQRLGNAIPQINISVNETNHVIIRCIFSFLSIGRESATRPANNCLHIMVCSCVVPSKRVLLQIMFCSCVIGTTFSGEK